MRDPEYDRFGPWILEISDTDPVPPVFVPYVRANETPLMAMKIPRPKERRDLKPGMHMYDYLVSLFEERIEILARDGDEAARFEVPYSDIAAVKHCEDLLDGHLHIYSPEIAYDLPYSTVSVDIIEKALKIIRERYLPKSASAFSTTFADDEGVPDTGELSFLFSALVEQAETRRPTDRLFAVQAERRLTDLDARRMHRLFYGAVDKRLLETVHFIDGREIRVISRGRTWAYRWQAVYGKDTLYVPLARLADAVEDEGTMNAGISKLSLSTDVSKHAFAFTADNPAMERYRTIVLGR